jgi:hypothetical protein
LHADQTLVNRLEHVVQSTIRDEQITSDHTQFQADQHIAHITETEDHAILDSGASIPVIPPKVVDDLHLTAINLELPIRVRMANGSTEHIHQVVDLGPIIGHAAILPSATQTLIGLGPLMELGYEVHFSLSGVGLFLNSKLIYKGIYDRERRLFQINLKDLILPSLPINQLPFSDDTGIYSNIPLNVPDTQPQPVSHSKKQAESKKRLKRTTDRQTDTIDPALVKEALWLHKRLGHPSRQVMMKSISNQSWTGIPHGLTPAIIDSVFHHLDCTACALGKRNKLPREKGSGIHPVDVGHTLSFDYQPVTSPSITGHTGYFLFKCLFSGFRHAVLVKSKDRKTLIEATKQVNNFYHKHGF